MRIGCVGTSIASCVLLIGCGTQVAPPTTNVSGAATAIDSAVSQSASQSSNATDANTASVFGLRASPNIARFSHDAPTNVSTASPTSSPTASGSASVAPTSLCVAGTQYSLTQDEEFANDVSLSTSPNAVPVAQSSATRLTWSTQFNWGGGAFYNNGGVDDAYYEDPTLQPAANPFSVGKGSLVITASPLATPTMAPDGHLRHWASGELTGPQITYGYVEFSARIPNTQGFWPALWLHPANSDTFLGTATAAEYDVEELFGTAYAPGTVQQTSIPTYSSYGSANYTQSDVSTAGTNYHTYGILWTSIGVNFYIDRVPTTPVWPNLTNGPENPQITLQVFASGSWGPAPPSAASQTMSLLYYRAYQINYASCAPSNISMP